MKQEQRKIAGDGVLKGARIEKRKVATSGAKHEHFKDFVLVLEYQERREKTDE